ncbi:MAG: cardiolipin synthase [Acholeplasmatales bacterium]|nr:cardiolipin synthase [Acholeplasmatales bacterium]
MIYSERRSLPAWKRIILYLFSFLFLIIQIAGFVALIYFSYASTSGVSLIYLGIELIGLILCITIVKRNINANYKLTWCILILLFPIFFGVLYLLNLTSRHISKKKRSIIHNAVKNFELDNVKESLKDTEKEFYNMASVVERVTLAPVSNTTKFTFYNNINDKDDDMFESLKCAKKRIYLEYFIISPGKLTDKLLEILTERGEAGVEIKILYDDIGCRGHNNGKIIKKLSKIKNCEVCAYEALGSNFNFLVNYRNHRKLAIIDSVIAYCGGDNLADEYVNLKNRFGYWRDNCAKYEGEAAYAFTIQFVEMWYASTKTVLDFQVDVNEIKKYENVGYVMPFTDGPQYIGNATYDLFTSLISHAKSSIYISTPYFIIDDALLNLISLKCRQGIDVKILMPHIPDKRSPFYMGREKYGPILANGGKIYEFEKGFNHAKNIIVDNKYVFIGTANMDYRSLFLHFECGALIMNDSEIKKMSDDFINATNESIELSYVEWLKRPLHQKIIAFILNILGPMF